MELTNEQIGAVDALAKSAVEEYSRGETVSLSSIYPRTLPLDEALIDGDGEWGNKLCCPRCDGSYVHRGRILQTDDPDNDDRLTVIVFWCEHCASRQELSDLNSLAEQEFSLVIREHKGEVFVSTSPGSDVGDRPVVGDDLEYRLLRSQKYIPPVVVNGEYFFPRKSQTTIQEIKAIIEQRRLRRESES